MVIEQILNCSYRFSLKRLYLEGKVMELIALRLMQLLDESRTKIQRISVPLSHRDVDRIHEAKEILLAEISDPPSIQELAGRIGINTKKLKYGFRQIYGSTVFSYLRHIRLDTARRKLQEEKISVTEAALYVGYNSLSHFSRIFKEEFGFAPSRLHQ